MDGDLRDSDFDCDWNDAMNHTMQAWDENDQEYVVHFCHTKATRQTLEYPGDPEDVEIEQVFLNGKEVQVSEQLIDKWTTQAWEIINEDEDPPDDWKREWECNYER